MNRFSEHVLSSLDKKHCLNLSSWSDQKKTLFFLLSAFSLYLPFIFLGLGTDIDSYGVIRSGSILLNEHRYVPSRYPGYFLHEIANTILFLLGKSVLTNLGTLAMSMLALYLFIKICQYHRIANKYLLGSLMLSNPIYWVSSTSTTDHTWALAFLLLGWWFFLKKSFVLGAVMYGLAVGARLSSVPFVGAFFLSYVNDRSFKNSDLFKSACISVLVGLSLYIPPFVHAGCNLGFLHYYIFGGRSDLQGYIARFIYKNIYFWGLQMVIGSSVMLPAILRGFRQNYSHQNKILIVFCIFAIVSYEALFLKLPIEKAYLIPMMPFALMLLGVSLKSNVYLLKMLLILQLSYNFVSFNIARPDVPNAARAATIGLWLECGYLLRDIVIRMEILHSEAEIDYICEFLSYFGR